MNIPRSNNFRIILPDNIIPTWVKRMYTDILRDAKLLSVYDGNPSNCIVESLTGFESPGKHVTLGEQKKQDASQTGYVTVFYPKGVNAMRTIADDEFALDFRHIDGYHNYHMLEQALLYMTDDFAQSSQSEAYKQLDPFYFEEHLTENWRIVNIYSRVVYKQIDGNSFKYADGPSEKTFTVRFKFSQFQSLYYYKDKLISQMNYNHAIGR